jgi:cyclopentanol dehydrogenase
VFDLHGKVAIVTGGASGIGKSAAELFADVGASVLVADVNDISGQRVVDGIGAAGGMATFQHTDVSVVKDLQAMIDRAFEVYCKLDILFNNAGIAYFKGSLSTSEEEFRKTMDVNLKSVFFGSKFAAEKMKTGGSIINTSSVNAVSGSADVVAYSASKGGVLALTVALAKEFAPRGIRVNCIIPGPIDTPINDTRPEIIKDRQGTLASFANATLLKRIGRPIDVAYGALYLASDASAYVTGSALTIDGGYLAAR